jgi:YD repeat-containing protein
MNKKTVVFLVLILCMVTQGFSQYQQNLPQPKPIPPNAAAMFKVLERPLGTFTGTMPISFPLCSVSSGSLSADLSLNYTTTGGIKVEELASCVGLGFSLSDGGGRITQQVRGWPDDWSSGMLNNPYLKPSQFNSSNNSHLYYADHDQLDLEPDVFMYSFGGKSGKFFFKENGELVKMTNDGIVIEIIKETNAGAPGGIGFRAFIITDEKGNKYYFGRKKDGSGNYRIVNMSSYSSGSSSSPGKVSSISYFLTEVYDMNSENSIKYSYIAGGNSFIGFAGSGMPLTLGGLNCQGFNTFQNYGTVETDGAEYMVSRIDASSGYIIFNTASDYTNGPKKVTSIDLYDSSNNFRKKYKFNYGTSFSSNRWKLTSFSEFGSSGTDSLTHKFEYDEFNNLPTILTGSMDMWGFYNNGANNNTALIPNIIVSNGYGSFYWDFWANRVANGFYAQANILTKITYPTGGYRQMEYEGNKAAALGDFFSYHPDANFMITRTFTESNFHNYGTYMPCLQRLFTASSSYGLSKFYYTLNSVNTALCGNNYNVKIYRLLDSTDTNGGALIYTFNGQESGSWNLPNGYYRVDVNLTSSPSYCTIGSITGSWSEGIADTAPMITTPYGTWHRRQYNAGGVRVKAVKDYDPVGGKTYTTRYYYKMYSVDSTMGSGLLASPVDITSQENNWYTRCQYVKVGGNTAYPLASDGGSFVVYPEVRTVEDSVNGWTDRIYTYAYDQPGYGFPATPLYDYSYYRGKLAQEKVYRQDNKLLKKTMNEWMWSIPKSQISKRVKMYWHRDPLGTPYSSDYWSEGAPSPGGCNDEFSDCIADITDVSDYYFNLPVTVPYQSIDSVFSADASGISQVVKTNYSYDTSSGGVYFLKQKKVTINNNQTKEQSYKYAFTPVGQFNLGLTSGEQSIKTSLLNLNYLQPLEVTDSIKTSGGSPVFQTGAKYIFSNSSGKMRLSQFRGYTSSSDYNELNFSGYDSRGNLTEQYKTNDVKEVYLWGYRGTVPIAKVTGSTYATIAGYVNLSVLNNPSSEAAMRTELDKIHTGLAGSLAQVTTYTYDTRYGMTSMKDPSGKLLTYSYDVFGRLVVIKDQAGKVVKKYCYNYHGQSSSCSLYGNVAKSGNYTRNNCSSGYQGSTVTYNVAANTYYATTQTEADAMAQNDVNTNGQAYANANGTCTQVWYNVQKSGNFTRNNCGSGYTGSTETYIVYANTYSSTTSQAAADALAQNDVNANGQNYANTYGTCTSDNITVHYQKNSYTYNPVYFTFTNLDTYQQYNFQTPYGSYPYYGNLGQLPPGYYEVEIYNPYNYNYHYYETNCYDYTSGYQYAYFYFIYLDDYCNTIQIDY